MVETGPWVVTWRKRRTKARSRKLTTREVAKKVMIPYLERGVLNPILAWQRWTYCCRGDGMGHRAHREKVGMRRARWSTAIGRRRSVEETEEAFVDYQRQAAQNVLEVLWMIRIVSRCT
jgi:hypothetical protein